MVLDKEISQVQEVLDSIPILSNEASFRDADNNSKLEAKSKLLQAKNFTIFLAENIMSLKKSANFSVPTLKKVFPRGDQPKNREPLNHERSEDVKESFLKRSFSEQITDSTSEKRKSKPKDFDFTNLNDPKMLYSEQIQDSIKSSISFSGNTIAVIFPSQIKFYVKELGVWSCKFYLEIHNISLFYWTTNDVFIFSKRYSIFLYSLDLNSEVVDIITHDFNQEFLETSCDICLFSNHLIVLKNNRSLSVFTFDKEFKGIAGVNNAELYISNELVIENSRIMPVTNSADIISIVSESKFQLFNLKTQVFGSVCDINRRWDFQKPSNRIFPLSFVQILLGDNIKQTRLGNDLCLSMIVENEFHSCFVDNSNTLSFHIKTLQQNISSTQIFLAHSSSFAALLNSKEEIIVINKYNGMIYQKISSNREIAVLAISDCAIVLSSASKSLNHKNGNP
ncbi:hypothetical protein BB560_003128 [Smittium megazygosporum]|uniref:Uncharacterized protein n=1 Tax=Smittium megazygosporum TaxID=133381 RepID=A0A2T9ZCW9_9FUNG|nr:hypothetical protein BB560_003128 [Smittium megazygosporum]